MFIAQHADVMDATADIDLPRSGIAYGEASSSSWQCHAAADASDESKADSLQRDRAYGDLGCGNGGAFAEVESHGAAGDSGQCQRREDERLRVIQAGKRARGADPHRRRIGFEPDGVDDTRPEKETAIFLITLGRTEGGGS